MLIAGGVYVERCSAPPTFQLLGSGGRAALALSAWRENIQLHTFHPADLAADLVANFAPSGIDCKIYPSSDRITFSYLFPLSRSSRTPSRIKSRSECLLRAPQILAFDCIEGSFVPQGEMVVIDPQGSDRMQFRAAGGQAESLAIVLNANEALRQTSASSLGEAATKIFGSEAAQVLIVKDGPRGATIFTAMGDIAEVPPYSSTTLYKIGSGDVFSAVFAHYWFTGTCPIQAADLASRHTAAYVNSPNLPLSRWVDVVPRRMRAYQPEIFVVAPHMTLKDQLLRTMIADALEDLGLGFREITAEEWRMEGARSSRSSELEVGLICSAGADEAWSLHRGAPLAAQLVHFVDLGCWPSPEALPPRAFTDLSQAIYELNWEQP